VCRRLILGIVLVLELILTTLVVREIQDFEGHYRNATEALLTDSAHLAAALLAADLREGNLQSDRIRIALPELRRLRARVNQNQGIPPELDFHIYVTDHAGRVIYDSRGQTEGNDFSGQEDVRKTLNGDPGTRLDRQPGTPEPSAVLYVAAPILWQDVPVGVVSIGRPVMGFELFLTAARKHLLVGGAYTGLALLVLAVGLTLWWLRPLDLIVEYGRLLRQGQFQKLPNLGRSAFGWVGAVFDEMRDALAGRCYVEAYIQSLTHEIKCPLAVIRADAEYMEHRVAPSQRRKFLSDIQDAVSHIQAIVDRLLELAALEKRRGLSERRPVKLADVAAEAVEALTPDAKARQVDLAVDVLPKAVVEGQRALLVCALIHLVQNAVEFSPEGGRITIGLTEAGSDYELTVRDQGPGIPVYARRRLFEHFYSLPRPGTQKRSTGLGLSFVREIAELHHGRVAVGNHPEGGAIARLRLPRSC
jgi:two-component system sensor histidine kinase CreC